MTSADLHRCRWHLNAGRCPNSQAFPDLDKVPPFCAAHLLELEPWAAHRAALRQSGAEDWIRWAAHRAADVERDLLAIGALRPARAIDDGRPVRPQAPDRR